MVASMGTSHAMSAPGEPALAARTTAFRLGDWIVQPALVRIEEGDVHRRLEPKVMDVLLALAEAPGQVRSKQELLDTVWADTFVADGVLLRSISELRRAFDDDVKAPRFIETIPKRGYRLIAPIRPTETEEHRPSTPRTGPPVPEARPGRVRMWAFTAIASVAVLAGIGWLAWREAPTPIPDPPTAPPTAQGRLSRAHAFFERGTSAANANAIELFKQALEEDPDDAAADAGLAAAYAEGVRRFGLDR